MNACVHGALYRSIVSVLDWFLELIEYWLELPWRGHPVSWTMIQARQHPLLEQCDSRCLTAAGGGSQRNIWRQLPLNLHDSAVPQLFAQVICTYLHQPIVQT